MDNLFTKIPDQLPDESTEILLQHSSTRIERIVSDGHKSPENFWYNQDEHEWLVLLQGSASIEYLDGELIKMVTGDYCLIPAQQKHRVVSTSKSEKTIWLAVFYT